MGDQWRCVGRSDWLAGWSVRQIRRKASVARKRLMVNRYGIRPGVGSGGGGAGVGVGEGAM